MVNIELYKCRTDENIVKIVDINEKSKVYSNCKSDTDKIIVGISITCFFIILIIVTLLIYRRRQRNITRSHRQALLNKNFEDDLNEFIAENKTEINENYLNESRFPFINRIQLGILKFRMRVSQLLKIKKTIEKVKYDDNEDNVTRSGDEVEMINIPNLNNNKNKRYREIFDN